MIRVTEFGRWLMLCVCFVAASTAFANAAEDRSVDFQFEASTLAGIYELAVIGDQTIAQARAIYRTGAEERRLAMAGLLPNVEAGYRYQESDSANRGAFPAGTIIFPNETDTRADTNVWNVSLAQPLFDMTAWFRFQQGVQLSKEAEASFAVAQQDLILRTVLGYFEVMRTKANLSASRAQESALEAQLDQVQQRFDVGLVALTDVQEARAGYDLGVAQTITDDGELGINIELLSVLTGRPHGDLWILKPSFPVVNPEPAEEDAWVDFARLHNLDIKSAEFARNAARQGFRAAKSEHLPKLNLSLSYFDSKTAVTQENLISGRVFDFPADQKQALVSIALSMPIFTGGFISASRRQADARRETQVATHAGTVRDVTQQTRAFHIRVLSDVARNQARARAVISTKSALEAAEVGFQVGTRNAVDVLRAQQTYYSAVRDYDNSYVDYVENLVRLKRLAGTLAPEDIYELNSWLKRPPPATLSGERGTAPSGRTVR